LFYRPIRPIRLFRSTLNRFSSNSHAHFNVFSTFFFTLFAKVFCMKKFSLSRLLGALAGLAVGALAGTAATPVQAQAQSQQKPQSAAFSRAAITDGYTLTVPGKLQSDGTYSLAKVVTIARPAEGTYLRHSIIVKTKQRFVMGKNSTAFQSSAISSVLDAYTVAGVRTIAPEFNSGKRVASDDYGMGRVYEVRFAGAVDVISVCRDLNTNPDIEYAEPIYVHRLHQDRSIPNDPLFAAQYALERVQAAQAWNVIRGDSTIIIGIVDSGVDWEHEDLAANIWTNPGESGNDAQGRDRRSNGVDDDGNGKIDDWHGWDLVGAITDTELDAGIFREDNDPKSRRQTPAEEDENLHGTHVAGLASAVTNNGRGVAGAAYNCRLLPVKCGTDRIPGVFRGYEGILYAAQMGAHVINNSWGGGGFSLYNQDVINTATALGSLVVASAGNAGTLMDNAGFPASYDNVLTVGNSTINDIPLSTANGNGSGSSFGIKTEVWAPGTSVQSTYLNNNQYGPLTGTSMSSPLAAGIAALVRKQHPDWSPRQVTEHLRITSDNVFNVGATAVRGNPDDRPPLYFGRLNAFRAVTANRVLNQGDDQLPGVITAGASVAGVEGAIAGYQSHRFVLRVQNILSNARDVSVMLTPIDGRGTVLTGTQSVGTLNTMEQKLVTFDLQLTSLASGAGTTDYLVTYRATSPTGTRIVNYDRLTVAYRLPAVRQPLLVVSPLVDYGIVTPGTSVAQSVSVRNFGNQDVMLRSPVFAGANAAAFSLVTPFDSVLVAAGGSRTFPVRLNPGASVTTGGATATERTATASFSATSSGVLAGSGSSALFTADYAFESVRGSFEEFTDGTRLAGGAGVDDNDYETAIGFPFRFGTTTLERMNISSNGYIVFAPSAPVSGQTTTVQTPFFARGTVNAAGWISAFASDLQCRTDGDIRIRVTGTAPNRVCTVQWRRMSFWEAGTDFAPDANLTFQIRLYEGTNRIEQVYGAMSFAGTARGANSYMGIGQVGLLGTTDNDFQTRRVRINASVSGTTVARTAITNTWESSVEGGLGSFAEVSPTLVPPVGLTYRWNYEPSVPTVTALQRTAVLRGEVRATAAATSTTATLNFGSVTSGTNTTRTVMIRNIGTAALTTTQLALVTTPTVPAGVYTLLDSALTIPSGDSARVRIRFAPSTNAIFAAALRVDGNTDPLQIPILGIGTVPASQNTKVLRYGFTGADDFAGGSNILSRFDRFPQLGTGTLIFTTIGSVKVASDIELRSRGTEPITVTGVTVTGIGVSEFVITQPQFPITLRPGQVQALRVEYRPLVAGEKSVDLRFNGDIQDQSPLSFSSVAALPRFISVNPRSTAELFPAPPLPEDVRDRYTLAVTTTEVGESSVNNLRLQHSTAATAPARITAIRITGEAARDYTIDSAFVRSLPLTLAPGASRIVGVTFRPTAPSDRLASLVVVADGTPAEEDINLAGVGLERRFFVNRAPRLFTTEVGTTSASQTINVFGDANQAVTITGTPRLEGRDAADFVLTLPSPFNRRLALDSLASFRVAFAPRSLGQKQAQFALQSDVGPVVVQLFGTSILVTSATLRTTPVSAAPGATVNVPVVLSDRQGVGNGTQVFADVRVNATTLVPVAPTPDGVVVDGQRIIPLSLTFNGDSVLTTLRFRAQLGSELSTPLQLSATAITGNANVRLALNSGRFTLTNVPAAGFPQPAYEQFQNRDIAIPLTFSNRPSIPAGSPMTTTLDYNASLLDLQSGAAAASRSFNATTGLTTLRFVVPNGAADSTVTLNFKAAIGNTPNTPLSLVSTFASGLRIVSASSATFTVKGLNQAGGTRLYYSSKTTLKVLASSPNPVSVSSEQVQLTFALSHADTQASTPVALALTDVFGRTLTTYNLGSLGAGEHTVSVPLSQLTSGTYFLTLTGAGAQATTRVQALR
jgi:subtilisin family serine protease